jgi:hypothetical protein
MHSQSSKYAHQTATNTVSICEGQGRLHATSHSFYSPKSSSLTSCTHWSCGESTHSQSFKYADQTATNTVSKCNAKICLQTISHSSHSLNSYSLTDYNHSSILQSMHSQSLKYAHQTDKNTVNVYNTQTIEHATSRAFHILNSYSLTPYTHSIIQVCTSNSHKYC